MTSRPGEGTTAPACGCGVSKTSGGGGGGGVAHLLSLPSSYFPCSLYSPFPPPCSFLHPLPPMYCGVDGCRGRVGVGSRSQGPELGAFGVRRAAKKIEVNTRKIYKIFTWRSKSR